ncbi:MAG: DegT/DnrJ/EryC1/StrS family aminotransferase [Nanoarchaeota archaeon]|nr:DegT/DnrJ/EryC1/StrS family aminotransferase [Nanoarchaeota archaeon]
MQIPFLDLKRQYLSIKQELDTAISEIISSQRFILGNEVEQFEKEIANYLNVKHAIGVASGTDALFLSLKALGIKQGDKVITTPFTFIATAEVIANLGAIPVFVDIDPHTFNISADNLKHTLEKEANIKAIIPVHLFGQPAEIEDIIEIANGIPVIEDCAQSIGAEYNGRKTGTFGELGCFSFFPAKNLGCFGDGGLITTNSTGLYNKIRLLRNHGSSPEDKYKNMIIGHSSRLDALQARVLRIKLKHLDNWNNKRILNADYYDNMLQIKAPFKHPKAKHVYNQYTLRVQNRSQLRAKLKEIGIPTMVYYPLPLHLQPCFDHLNHKQGDFPEAEKACEEVLSIPIFPELKTEENEYIAKNLNELSK